MSRFARGFRRLVSGDVSVAELRGNAEARLRQAVPGKAADDFFVGLARIQSGGVGAPATTTRTVMQRRATERSAQIYEANHPGRSVTVSGATPVITPTLAQAAADTRETVIGAAGGAVGGTLAFAGDLAGEVLDEASTGLLDGLGQILKTPVGLAAAGTAAYLLFR